MARTYRPTPFWRLRDRMITFMLSKGVGPPGLYLLSVPGRKTGVTRTTPVAPLGTATVAGSSRPTGPAAGRRMRGRRDG
jgi:hypothetical protein